MDVPLPPGLAPPELTFAEFVEYVFDNAAEEDPLGAWSFVPWSPPNAVSLAYLTRLFEDPAPVLAPYSDGQVNAGLYHLVTNGAGNHLFAIADPALPLEDRLRCVRAMGTLYEALFAVRCAPELSHGRRGWSADRSPLNGLCYMWWDVLTYVAHPGTPALRPIDLACLEVMRRALALPHPACQESALHGLGHWMRSMPREAGAIVDGFLARMDDAPEALQEYARWARSGMVQ